jgi:prephenate dehydrogenase
LCADAEGKRVIMREMGVIGFGNFGQFMARHLAPYFSIAVCDRPGTDVRATAERLGVTCASPHEASAREIVILCAPVQDLEGLLMHIHGAFRPDALILDVASVKAKPVALMQRYAPPTAEIVATHPLFGPVSGRNGIAGLPIALCPVRTRRRRQIRRFLAETLKLRVIECSPEAHDREMAYVQGLTHFIGRALNVMNIADSEQKTAIYHHLLAIKETVGSDSDDLFLTIQRENPAAQAIREEFLRTLRAIHERI